MEIQMNQDINIFKTLINQKLDEFIPVSYPEKLWEAMRYSVLGDGKRLRGLLCLESCRALNGSLEAALPAACAIEIIHAQSLIHDDLPCMDNDDFRRGKPSTHRQFGEALAVLAGDALIPLAYEVFITRTPPIVKDSTRVQIIKEFSETIGATGLVGGQSVDCETEGKTINKETLNYIHNNKTGALYRFALRAGAILAECTSEKLNAITRYAENIGLAFQISDDILDITGSKENLGKTPGKDKASGKNTYPSLYGMETSLQELEKLCNEAIIFLNSENINSEILVSVANLIKNRVR
jgi:geranylgeranyl diphosphate synthase type II